MTIWLPDGYHIGTAQVPDSIGTVISMDDYLAA